MGYDMSNESISAPRPFSLRQPHQSRSCVESRLMPCQVSKADHTAEPCHLNRGQSVFSGQLNHGLKYQRVSFHQTDQVSIKPDSTQPITRMTQVAASASRVLARCFRNQCQGEGTVDHGSESQRKRARTESSLIGTVRLRRNPIGLRKRNLLRSHSSLLLNTLRRRHRRPLIHLTLPVGLLRRSGPMAKTCLV